jgi:hypothetical protein
MKYLVERQVHKKLRSNLKRASRIRRGKKQIIKNKLKATLSKPKATLSKPKVTLNRPKVTKKLLPILPTVVVWVLTHHIVTVSMHHGA